MGLHVIDCVALSVNLCDSTSKHVHTMVHSALSTFTIYLCACGQFCTAHLRLKCLASCLFWNKLVHLKTTSVVVKIAWMALVWNLRQEIWVLLSGFLPCNHYLFASVGRLWTSLDIVVDVKAYVSCGLAVGVGVLRWNYFIQGYCERKDVVCPC